LKNGSYFSTTRPLLSYVCQPLTTTAQQDMLIEAASGPWCMPMLLLKQQQ
jgi:hypothetical protein